MGAKDFLMGGDLDIDLKLETEGGGLDDHAASSTVGIGRNSEEVESVWGRIRQHLCVCSCCATLVVVTSTWVNCDPLSDSNTWQGRSG